MLSRIRVPHSNHIKQCCHNTHTVVYLTMGAEIAKGSMVEELDFDFRQGQEIFLFSAVYGPALGLTQISSQWEQGGFLPHLSISDSTLFLLLDFGRLFGFLFLYTVGRTPWMEDQHIARSLPTHRTTQTQNKHRQTHPCLEWDSNPRSQRSKERRQFMPQTVRPPWSAPPRAVEVMNTWIYTFNNWN
jgi:hypothetical protein